MQLSIDEITSEQWSLSEALLEIKYLNQTPQISLSSAVLTLPPPFEQIKLLSIQCQKIAWDKHYLNCAGGTGQFKSRLNNLISFAFSLLVDHNKSEFTLSHFSLFGAEISIHAQEKAEKWQLSIQAKHLNLDRLKTLFADDVLAIMQGMVDVNVELSGEQDNLQSVQVTALVDKLNLQDKAGLFVSENSLLKISLCADKKNKAWYWQTTNRILAGEMFVDPVYLKVESKSVRLIAKGIWQPEQAKTKITELTLEHAGMFTLQANAEWDHQAETSMTKADITVQIPQLKSATATYILPFLESSALADIDLSGSVEGRFKIKQNNIIAAKVIVNHLSLDNSQTGLSINQANAQLNWAEQQQNTLASFIDWQQLKVQAIPFQAGRLDFISFAKQFSLVKRADLAVLGGIISIHNLSYSAAGQNSETKLHFQGSVKQLSLQQLSKALGWTPLSGTISGNIPSVNYQDNLLSLEGELKMQVFDGEVIITNLASSGLLSDFPQFYTDIQLKNLDLGMMTRQFHTGYIEGRVSGDVKNLYMENWQAVSFYAWIGTPEDDSTTHRISQKAVENIASIGGGGVSDVLSRGFLGLFSTFGYKKLGFGCYLHQGVCQLMGVEAVDNGFYLIKGGGLPRIDVIGYTPHLDWNILLNSLQRITASDEAIIK